ncbi:uncharacterized protein LOC132618769 isoform X2 [Lycium barbarum]|uniref:uncharacterized protein LOC132618769 isoform X2 n=1 Tax=Lycium barbarum TaxID=112863 RepID=UPI00293EC4B6|nr:uncharacterized protein LOC132618769 isoform X2 [Lycium barbarum]
MAALVNPCCCYRCLLSLIVSTVVCLQHHLSKEACILQSPHCSRVFSSFVMLASVKIWGIQLKKLAFSMTGLSISKHRNGHQFKYKRITRNSQKSCLKFYHV